MSLVDRFAHAGLELDMAGEPLRDVGSTDVFQMDVASQRPAKKSRPREVFRIWRGHQHNRLQVVGMEAARQQLVLMVHEPTRQFVTPFSIPGGVQDEHLEKWVTRFAANRGLQARDVVVAGDRLLHVTQRTPDTKRHYLCGTDERQLFIAQLPSGVSTVRQAHEALAPRTIGRVKGRRVRRQGEWFFVEATSWELEAVRDAHLLVEHKAPCGAGGGRPHIADEAVTPPQSMARFVRGAIRHPDHKTLKLKAWHRVVLNREVRGAVVGVGGSLWID